METTLPDFEYTLETTPPSLRGKLLLTVLTAVGKLPLGLRQRAGRACGRLFGRLPTRERRIAELQLRAFLPSARPDEVIPEVFGSLGQTVLEGLNLEPLIRDHQRTIYCRQPELMNWASSIDRPILGLTAHTGNWELFAAYLRAQDIKIVAIGRPARSSVLQETLAAMRARAGVKVLWRAGQGGMREIYSAFRSRCVVGALIDQDTRVTSVPVPFFGEPAQTPVTLVHLAKKHNALIFSAFIIREADNRFALDIRKLDENGSTEEILREYHEALEAVIREHPAQWVWFHKRWRTLPNGDRRSSSEYQAYLHQRCSQ